MVEKRGILNHNPGLITWGDDWTGLRLKAQRTDAVYAQFTAPKHGVRALAATLAAAIRRSQRLRGTATLRSIVQYMGREHWSTNEHFDECNVYFIANQMKCMPDSTVAKEDVYAMTCAIIVMHNHDNPYAETLLKQAVQAGLA